MAAVSEWPSGWHGCWAQTEQAHDWHGTPCSTEGRHFPWNGSPDPGGHQSRHAEHATPALKRPMPSIQRSSLSLEPHSLGDLPAQPAPDWCLPWWVWLKKKKGEFKIQKEALYMVANFTMELCGPVDPLCPSWSLRVIRESDYHPRHQNCFPRPWSHLIIFRSSLRGKTSV